MGFPQLRLESFRAALVAAGHDLRVVCLGDGQTSARAGRWAGVHTIDPDAPDALRQLGALADSAEALVAAGPYLPGKVACLVAGARPVWADLPGDPFAELQAAMLAPEAAVSPARIAAARAAALTTLSRADALSVISDAQRMACLGQLGLLGRLVPGAPPEGPVHTLPIPWQLPMARGQPQRRAPGSPLVVALSGSFNTWLDDEALAWALERLLAAEPLARVVCTGGGIDGHYTAGAARFARWAQHQDRVTLHGWVSHDALAGLLGGAHLGLLLDRPGCEAALGSRTRALLFAWLGLPIAASTGCSLLAEMADEALIHPLPVGDAAAVAQILIGIARRGGDGAMARAASDWLAQRFPPARCLAPLLSWAAAPTRSPPAPELEALVVENHRLQQALRDVHGSRTWRTLSRGHRLARRLGLRWGHAEKETL